MPRMASLFRLLLSVTLLEAIFLFTTWYVFCLEHLVWFESLIFSLPQSSLLYTPFGRSPLDWNLLEYSSASLISFELDSFCSSASLISFRAWWWLNFVEIVDLSWFTYIILTVSYNSMVFAMVIKLVLEWWASKLGIIKTIIESELDAMINLILDNCFEIWR